jgi:hypothetical protein
LDHKVTKVFKVLEVLWVVAVTQLKVVVDQQVTQLKVVVDQQEHQSKDR